MEKNEIKIDFFILNFLAKIDFLLKVRNKY